MPDQTQSPSIGSIRLSRIGVGCSNLTGPGVWDEPADRGECVRVLRRAVDLGVNLFDTADSYGPYVSEEIVREALHPYPADIIIGTKVGELRAVPTLPGTARPAPLGRPEYLRYALEMSLRRLRTDHLRLVHLHRPDPHVPFADQIGAMKELHDAGKIGNVGLSNVSVEQLDEARTIIDIVSIENRFNVVERTEAPMLARCEELGIVFLPFFPLGLGRLVGPESPVLDLARRANCTPAQFALAWLLHRSPAFVPIPGPMTLAHLEENLSAAEIELSTELFDEGAALEIES